MEFYSFDMIDNCLRLEEYNENGERLLTVNLQGQYKGQTLKEIVINAVLGLILAIDFDEISKEKHGVEKISLQILNSLGASIALNQPWVTSQDNEYKYLSVVEEYIKKIKQIEHLEGIKHIHTLQSNDF